MAPTQLSASVRTIQSAEVFDKEWNLQMVH